MSGKRVSRRRFLALASAFALGVAFLSTMPTGAQVAQQAPRPKRITRAEREAAAQRLAAQRTQIRPAALLTPTPGGTPDYYAYANWANSPQAGYDVEVMITPAPGDTTGSGATAVAVLASVYITFLPQVHVGSTTTAVARTNAATSGRVSPASVPGTTGHVASIIVVNGGSGYTLPPIVTIISGKGTGATAVATIVNGVVTEITVTNPGYGYGLRMDGDKIAGIRKFVDRLPGLGFDNRNGLGQYMPVGIPDKTTYPGSDYYEIELGEYAEQLHSDLPPTTLRGYRQTNSADPNVTAFHSLGPMIVAERGTPVRVKFTNNLPTGEGGNLFLPTDTTVMGAGMGPLGMDAMPMNYSQNRATLHLHGGATAWISDGTAHQWVTPQGETTDYPQGVSVFPVPDMDDTGDPRDGVMTFYYSNDQSARLMFYHDHAFGITRLNVYAGEAAGYLLTDEVEQELITSGVLPDLGIPLIIQDKSFVDPTTIMTQDPTWMWGTGEPLTPQPPDIQSDGIARAPKAGDLWYPHVYVPAQNPADISGANPYGRWHYAPYFWPPATDLKYPPIPNPYVENGPWEAPTIPGTPNPSMPGEAFMDTPIVNGTAYPYLEVEPKCYRFRILNAADDRFFNLQWYLADPYRKTFDGRTNTEVKMVPAQPNKAFPPEWPTDGREGGVPDPATAGPDWIQIGTEGGFLPKPVVVPNQPVTWNLNPTTFNFGNVEKHSLLLGSAERADVIVDFSAFAGKTLILYNDAPAAFPALDSRYDYYTDNPDQRDTGGAPTTLAGFGPNTRTVMQVKVGTTVTTPYSVDLPTLEDAWAGAPLAQGVFARSQDPIIIPDAQYNSAYGRTAGTAGAFPNEQYIRQSEATKTFRTVSGALVNAGLEPKAIQDEMGEAFDDYGRMNGLLGLELRNTGANQMNFVLYGYLSPPVDILVDSKTPGEPLVLPNPNPTNPVGVIGDGTQIWRITHNGVDTHPIHFHLFNVQLINRVAWDGAVIPPDPNEVGWKETIRVNPLEHTYVAMRPVLPPIPAAWGELPNSVRAIDPTMPLGTELENGTLGFKDPNAVGVTVTNRVINFGHEYVYHCHILAHEEMDMMHAMVFAVAPTAPSDLAVTPGENSATLNWTDNSTTETGFKIQRSSTADFLTDLTTVTVGPDVETYTDNGLLPGTYYYRVCAMNEVGDTQSYAPAEGFPHPSVDSAFANSGPVVVGIG